jgi:hypothetical protein
MLPKMGTVDSRSELVVRRGKLEAWRGGVEYFRKLNGRLPVSLYEVAEYQNFHVPALKVSVTASVNIMVSEDPNHFASELEYGLFRSGTKWFICELVPGQYYPYRLLIDETGQVFRLESLGGGEERLGEERPNGDN